MKPSLLARGAALATFLLLLIHTATPLAVGQQPYLVKDINAVAAGPSFTAGMAIGSTFYFNGNDGLTGVELWKSDGTAAGTVLVKDIFPGPNGSSVNQFANVNGTLFFVANNGVNGVELWKSDGTAAGTALVKDIFAGGSSFPTSLVDVNGTLFFAANNGVNGPELWKSDGTAAGTVLVKDINAGGSSSNLNSMAVNGSTLYFQASESSTGAELWKSDGTAAGTTIVKDVFPSSSSSSPSAITVVNGKVFFRANDGSAGTELWTTDGTAAGTTLLKDVLPGTGGSGPFDLVGSNGLLFFVASNGTNGAELWKSDGSAAGTVLVKDIWPGSGSPGASQLVNAGNTLFFTASDGVAGNELWKSDGTTAGTALVKDIRPGIASSSPTTLTNIGGTLFFTATDATNGTELWRSDGTALGTVLIRDINPGAGSSNPSTITNVGGTAFFAADDGVTGGELWRSDGTGVGTVLVKSILPTTGNSVPLPLANVNGTLFFGATNGVVNTELWKSDGTEAGTVLVKDINPGVGASNPSEFASFNGRLFFQATDPNNGGTELWSSDGSAAGTVRVKDILAGGGSSSPQALTSLGGTLWFSAVDANGRELWKSDGTTAGTVFVKDVNPGGNSSNPFAFTAAGGTIYFVASTAANGTELWKTDGTAAGTVMVKDVSPGAGSSLSTSNPFLIDLNGRLLFGANDGVNGHELWTSDGTAAGTVLLKDVNPGAGNAAIDQFVVMNGILYFRGFEPGTGQELWRTDGTAAGTFLVKDIFPGANTANPNSFVVLNGTLIFSAQTGLGFEVWKSDGTGAGTVLVKDVNPAGSSSASLFTVSNGKVFFTATDATLNELWQTDGTAAGTVQVADLFPGTGSANPAGLTAINDLLFFRAQDGVRGIELWAVNTLSLNQTISVTSAAPTSAPFGSTFTVAATASSGLPVTIAAEPAGVCSVTAGGTGSASISMNSGTGSCTITYSQGGDVTYTAADDVTSTTTAARVDPAVTFTGAPASATFGSIFAVASSTESTAVPVYTSSGACSNAGTSYTMTSGAGVCTATVTWAADSNYNGAVLTQDTVAGLASQTISFAPLGNLTYGAAPFTLTATGGASGTAVVFSSTTPGVCTTTGMNGALATIVGAGPCSITASQSGTDDYAAADDVTRSFTVNKAESTTAVTGGSFVFDGSPHGASAVVSGVGTGITQAVSWSYSGSCSAAPMTVPEGASCVARADYAGDANHEPSFGVAAIVITKASSATAVSCPANVVYTGAALTPCTVQVSGAGGLSLTPMASYANNVDAGVGTASASYSFAGDDNHTGSSDTKSFSIAKAPSTTAVTGGSFTYDGDPHPASVLVSGAGTGITQTVSWSYSGSCSVAPTTVAEGASCVARADYAGDANHEASFGTAAVTITAAGSTTTVTFEAGPYVFRGTPFTASATVAGVTLSQAVPVVYSGDCLNVTSPNGCTATATFEGDANHTGSVGSASITIGQAVATVIITPYSAPFDGNAHGLSGSATGVGGVDLSANLDLGASFTNVPGGSATWTFAGGANYTTQSSTADVTITPAGSTTTVTFEPGPYPHRGTAYTATATVTGSGLSQPVPVSYSGDCLNVTSPNGCTATATFDGDANHSGSTGNASITIGKAAATVTITPYSAPYDGNAHGLSGSATGAGGVDLTSNLTLGATFTDAPGGTATWTFTGGTNYTDQSGSAGVTITPVASTTSVTFEAGPYVYRGTAFAATATVTGLNLSQTVPVVYGGDCLNVTSPNGCTATASFTGDVNHTGSTGSASVTVLQRPITVTAQPNTKVADGTTSAAAVPLVTAGTLAPGDTGHFLETYDTAAVGTNKTLTPSGFVTNAAASNVTFDYAITFVPSTAGVITAPPAGYQFSGFFAPIDMPQNGVVVWNTARAGQAIPAKWQLTLDGVPVSDPTSFAGLFSYQVNCTTGGAIEDPIEEYATGGSSLQYKGDGNWQFNWNTPSGYRNTCRVMNIKLKDGTYSAAANFKFR